MSAERFNRTTRDSFEVGNSQYRVQLKYEN